MNYRRNPRNDRRTKKFILAIAALVVLAILSSPTGWGMPSILRAPVERAAIAGARARHTLGGVLTEGRAMFSSRAALLRENSELRDEIHALQNDAALARVRLDDYEALKDIIAGTSTPPHALLAEVLYKPDHTPYDTLVVARGARDGVHPGDAVLAPGGILLGDIASVSERVSRATLYSSPGRFHDALVGAVRLPVRTEGRGGGMGRIELPREANVVVGDVVISPGNTDLILGVIGAIDENSTSSIVTAFFRAPVNIFELTIVEIWPRGTAELLPSIPEPSNDLLKQENESSF